jgi:DNA-binding NarL/FixJ family response regulator
MVEVSDMKTKVALVEDNGPLRQTFSQWVSQGEGLTLVGAFENAERALDELPALRPDVALVDINLPGADGIECVRQLKPLLPGTQFVMVTVYEDAQRIFRALAAGATGYLIKQATREELLAAIAEVRRGGSPMSAQIARKVVQSFQQGPQPEQAALSPREREVLEMLAVGLLYKEIASKLNCSVYTVNAHVRAVYEKLQVHSRSQAVAKFRAQ